MATRKQQRLLAVLRELGFAPPFSGPTPEYRIIVQKMIYLAQEVLRRQRMSLGYLFTWHARGPYALELARDLEALDAELEGGGDGDTDAATESDHRRGRV